MTTTTLATKDSLFPTTWMGEVAVRDLSWGLTLAAHSECLSWCNANLGHRKVGAHRADKWLPILEEQIKFFEERDAACAQ